MPKFIPAMTTVINRTATTSAASSKPDPPGTNPSSCRTSPRPSTKPPMGPSIIWKSCSIARSTCFTTRRAAHPSAKARRCRNLKQGVEKSKDSRHARPIRRRTRGEIPRIHVNPHRRCFRGGSRDGNEPFIAFPKRFPAIRGNCFAVRGTSFAGKRRRFAGGGRRFALWETFLAGREQSFAGGERSFALRETFPALRRPRFAVRELARFINE